MAYLAKQPDEDQYGSQSQSIQKQNQQQQQAGSNLNKSDAPQTTANSNQQQPAGVNSGGVANPAPGQFTKSNFSNASQILNRNQGADTSAITGRLLGNTQQEAAAEKNNYANQASTYKTNTTNDIDKKYNNYSPDQINSALSGNQADTDAISKTYNQQSADPLAAMNLQKYGDINSQEFYQNGNYQPLLQQRSQGNYTSGMGALDAAVLNKSNAGQQIRNQIAGYQNDVNDAYTKAAGTQDDLQNYANTKFGQEKSNLGNQLTGIQSGINSGIQSRLPAAQQALAQQAAQAKSAQATGLSAKTQAAIDQLTQQQAAGNQRTSGLGDMLQGTIDKLKGLNTNSYNPYINVNTPGLTANDVATQDEIDRNNRIASILGTNNYMQKGAAQAPTATVNNQGFDDFLKSITNSPDVQKYNDIRANEGGDFTSHTTDNGVVNNIKDFFSGAGYGGKTIFG